MIEQVSFDHETTFMPAPWRFEAGTPNIVGAIGLHAAIDYLRQFSFAHIEAHNRALFDCCYTQLDAMEAVQWLAPMAQSGAVLSFVHQQAHAHDVATILDHHGVAVRAGHHCAMPLMKALGVGATIRVSFGLYTQEQDIQALVAGLKAVSQLFQAV